MARRARDKTRARSQRRAAAPRPLGRAGSRTASASRSRTTTAASRKTVWENRRNLPFASRILRKGVCDGCALGVAGFHDWTISGVHLCSTRLDLLQVNTAPAIDARRARRRRHARELQRPRAARARPARVSDGAPPGRARASPASRGMHALDLIADRIRSTTPDRVALYLTARGITNEVYYVAQKAARAIGTNNVDNAARVCHAPSTTALKAGDRRRRHHVLVPRRDRERPDRACSGPTSRTASPCS